MTDATRGTAIYVRVSTQEQAERGYSVEEQAARARAYCTAQGWDIHKIYTDPGLSGAHMDNRPALQAMLSDVRAGMIDRVLVYKLDRLSRSQLDTLYIIERELLPYGCDFVSINENFDTSSPFGRAMLGILAVFAQLERETIKERMEMGREARIKSGLYRGSGPTPVGYNYYPGTSDRKGRLEVNDLEAAQIREIFNKFVNGDSIRGIATSLNRAGRFYRGQEWTNKMISRVLRQRLYIGEVSYKGEYYPGQHEALIDRDIFNEAQKRLKRRAELIVKEKRRPGKATSLLGGLLRCGHCGAPYQRVTDRKNGSDKRRYYYICASRTKKNPKLVRDPRCPSLTYRMQDLDQVVLDKIRMLQIDSLYEPPEIEETDQTAALRSEISDLSKRISRLLDLYAMQDAPTADITEKLQTLQQQKRRLETELEKLTIPDVSQTTAKDTAAAAILSIDAVLESGDLDKIRAILYDLIDHIILYDDSIDIHWRLFV